MARTTILSDPFWGDQPEILMQVDRLREFFPTADQTLPERMNAVTRLVIYCGIALAVYQEKTGPLQFSGILVAFLYLIWQNRSSKRTTIEKFEPEIQKEYAKVIQPLPMKQECTAPTLQNPYMNYLPGDDVTRGPACSGPGVQETAANLLNRGLFEDVDSLYEKSIGQRQFYTQPSTTPIADRDAFVNWLCKDIPSCKQDRTQCYPQADLRRYKPVQAYGDDSGYENVIEPYQGTL